MKHKEDIIIELSERATKFAQSNREFVEIDFDHLPFNNFTFYYPIAYATTRESAIKGINEIISRASDSGISLDPIQFAKIQNEMLNKKLYVNVRINDTGMYVSAQDSDREPLLEFKITTDSPNFVITHNYLDESVFAKSMNVSIGNEELESVAYSTSVMIFNVLGYLVKPKELITRVDRPMKEGIKTQHKRVKYKSKNKQPKYITKKVYIVEDFNPFIPSKERTYTRHTESWNVQGHWRQYKSGKRVWIKQQVRGNKDKEVKAQEYKITDMGGSNDV